jgi:hypothetical protein
MSWNLKHSFGVGLLVGAVIMLSTQSAWGVNFGQFAPPEKVYIVKICDDGDRGESSSTKRCKNGSLQRGRRVLKELK